MKPCDSSHITYAEIGVINYAKSLDRKIQRGNVDDIGAAIKRLRAAVERLEKDEIRRKSRGAW